MSGPPSWDDEYRRNERLWGERPSELATAAVIYLQKHKLNSNKWSMLDIGCGYGRDAFYCQEHLRCEILGIDTSQKAIDIALEASTSHKGAAAFRRCDFRQLKGDKYDVVFVSNLYQLLRKDERTELRDAAQRSLKPGGLLFLSTLSVNDPEHYGKGAPVPDEPNSFQDKKYLHLCTREELLDDFAFMHIDKLYEHDYNEPRVTGETHHHISWILIGEYR